MGTEEGAQDPGQHILSRLFLSLRFASEWQKAGDVDLSWALLSCNCTSYSQVCTYLSTFYLVPRTFLPSCPNSPIFSCLPCVPLPLAPQYTHKKKWRKCRGLGGTQRQGRGAAEVPCSSSLVGWKRGGQRKETEEGTSDVGHQASVLFWITNTGAGELTKCLPSTPYHLIRRVLPRFSVC